MSKLKLVFERQVLHLFLLAIILALVLGISRGEGFYAGGLWGLGTCTWFVIAVIVPIVHQVYVWLAWRIELHYSWLTERMGKWGLRAFLADFFLLLSLRVLSVIALAYSNQGSLHLDQTLLNVLSFLLVLPMIYTLYSIGRYFGFKRAAGIDHFDPTYREKPLVRQGIFKYSRNAMYTYGLLVVWLPGLLLASKAALAAALFNHAYIWVHYLCTEKPDMERIYGGKGD